MNQTNNNQNEKSLGRGLSSLIGGGQQINQNNQANSAPTAPYFPKSTAGVSNQILQLDLNKINVNPHQPRTEFDSSSLNKLVESIKEHGVLQPILVTEIMGSNYELIAGERRLRATKLAGLKKIPAIVRTAKELEKLQLSLIENIQRQDLNPIEKASSYKKLIDDFNLTHEEGARRLGISRANFSNTIRLLNLPTDVQRGLSQGKISMGQAKVLLEVKDKQKQEQLYQKATQTGQTVSDTQKEVEHIKRKTKSNRPNKNPHFKTLENQLQQKLNTRVNIRRRGTWGGVIEVEFYSEEELNALIEKLSQ